MAKKYSGQFVRAWVEACGFESQEKAALALGVPFRTFTRWIATGIPGERQSSIIYREHIQEKMEWMLEDCKHIAALLRAQEKSSTKP